MLNYKDYTDFLCPPSFDVQGFHRVQSDIQDPEDNFLQVDLASIAALLLQKTSNQFSFMLTSVRKLHYFVEPPTGRDPDGPTRCCCGSVGVRATKD